MAESLRIGTLAFAGSESTLGLSIVADAVRDRFPDAVVAPVDQSSAKHVDFLLVSLYWWRDVYAYLKFLTDAGIDPRQPKPHIILGGMAVANPRPLARYCHATILGDGEVTIADYIAAVSAGKPVELPSVWSPSRECYPSDAPQLNARQYVDLRTNKTTRIEIARGCKFKCPFCMLSGLKPYRELPFAVARHLIITAPTKTISLFAPDRMSYSRIDDLEAVMRKAGKRGTGSDARLELLKRREVVETVRFGVEGFAAKTRKKMFKLPTNEILLDGLRHITHGLKTPKGNLLASATVYMIGDLPGEGRDEIREFWQVLQQLDGELGRKFTIFLSVSSFAPSPYTSWASAGIHPWSTFNEDFQATRPRFENLVIATRGGLIASAPRLAQMLTIRGDERTGPALLWLATKGGKLLASRNDADGRTVAKVVAQTGYDPELLYSDRGAEYAPPWPSVAQAVEDDQSATG